MARITVAEVSGQHASLVFVGEFTGAPGELSSTFAVTKIIAHVTEPDWDAAEVTLPNPVDIPAWFTAEENRFKTAAEIKTFIDDQLGNLQARAEALRDDAIRRLSNIEANWAENFFGLKGLPDTASAAMTGNVRIDLAPLVLPGAGDTATVFAEFTLRVGYALNAGGVHIDGAYGFTVVFKTQVDKPLFRFDLDHLNFSLPEIEFPKLDFADIGGGLEIPTNVEAAVKALANLIPDVDAKVNVECVNSPEGRPKLVFDLGDPKNPKWSVEPSGGGDRLAKFKAVVSVKDGQNDYDELFTVEDITLDHDKIAENARLTSQQAFDLPDGKSQLGPLSVSWSGVNVSIEFAPSNVARKYVDILVKFEKLKIWVTDDPDAVIALKGEVLISPSSAAVKKLELVEPYPVVLVARAADEAHRLLSGISRIQFFTDRDEAKLPDLSRLMDVLARMASAVARSLLFAGKEAGDLIRQALVGLADMLGQLLDAFVQLANEAGQYVAIELRFTMDPFQLRQVLITSRTKGAPQSVNEFGALGVKVTLPVDAEPGLLIDLLDKPGAYIVAIMRKADDADWATISTDLWLSRKEGEGETDEPIRDADENTGERADNPILSLKIRPAALKPRAHKIIALAGLSKGEAIFFHWVDGEGDQIDVGGAKDMAVVGQNFALRKIETDDFKFDMDFEKDRALALLGLGEPGKDEDEPSSGGGFLDELKQSFSQVVWLKDKINKDIDLSKRSAKFELKLGVNIGGLETELPLELSFNLDDGKLKLESETDEFPIISGRIEKKALGLTWVIEPNLAGEELLAEKTEKGEIFTMFFEGPETGLRLAKGARMELRFGEVTKGGDGIVFEVNEFNVTRAGLDLSAKVVDTPVVLNGIDVPFRFTSGGIEIRGSKIISASIAGSGSLPPELIGDAPVSISLVFGESESGSFVLLSTMAELDKSKDPVVCHSTRFTFSINNVALEVVRDGGYHFYFLITGFAQFTPSPGEFENGLLKYLKDARIVLDRVPLTGDASVLAQHISFQVPMNPKRTFNLFELFEFELRGIGFHPSSPKFDGKPALNISGQIRFAEIGDIMQPSIDFHGLWIAPPKADEALPRIRADGLGLNIGLSGTAKISGTVLAVDQSVPTLEGIQVAPEGYDTYGFLGEGELSLNGLGSYAASMGFLEVTKQDDPSEQKKAFFLYIEKRKLAIEVPTPIWPLYMREVGFGFGYRYTLAGIKAAETATSPAGLIKVLDDVSKRQGNLSKFSAWQPDYEGENVTLALRGALQMAPAQKKWDQNIEEKTANPFFFDLIAALRSDMTFLMSVRGWLSVNYVDFLKDDKGLKEKPGYIGYLYISAPRSELLARFLADPKGHIGNNPALPPTLVEALRNIEWSATLYIRPGLFHFELGWPDQLRVKLVDNSNFKVSVRGGMVFRIADNSLLLGYNVEADAYFRFEGRAGGSSLGLAASAGLDARLLARVMALISFRDSSSMFYGLVSLHSNITFSVSAWLRIDAKFFKISINISFSFSLHISASIEMVISGTGIGANVNARVAICAFGTCFGIGVGFTFGDGQLSTARARVARFLSIGLTADTPDAKAVSARTGGLIADAHAARAASLRSDLMSGDDLTGLDADEGEAQTKAQIKPTNFWAITHKPGPGGLPDIDGIDEDDVDKKYAVVFLVPREAGEDTAGFYTDYRENSDADYEVTLGVGPIDGIFRFDWDDQKFVQVEGNTVEIKANWAAKLDADSDQTLPEGKELNLRYITERCFVDGEEPTRRQYKNPARVEGADEDERNAVRAAAQMQWEAHANTVAENEAHEWRSMLLAQFLEQFVAAARDGVPPGLNDLHVVDTGLVFLVDIERIGAFDTAEIRKIDQVPELGELGSVDPGTIRVFNRPDTWFANAKPDIKLNDHQVSRNGIDLDWELSHRAWSDARGITHLSAADKAIDQDAEQVVHYYRIEREVETRKQPFNVKAAATFGLDAAGGESDPDKTVVGLLRSDWQFSDDLNDLPLSWRKALLPDVAADGLEAAVSWVEAFGSKDQVDISYDIIPHDIGGTQGRAETITVKIPRPEPPVRPAQATLRFILPKSIPAKKPDFSDPKTCGLSVVLAVNDRHWTGDPDVATQFTEIWDMHPIPSGDAYRRYRIIIDPEDVVPAGSYGVDGQTERLIGPRGLRRGFESSADKNEFVIETGRISDARLVDEDKPGPNYARMVEPDDETRKAFKYWIQLAGEAVDPGKDRALIEEKEQKFLRRLWSREVSGKDDPRVAVRCFLQTEIVVYEPSDEKEKDKKEKDRKVIFSVAAEPVPLTLDIRVQHVDSEDPEKPTEDSSAIRPEAFEWPSFNNYPPLQKNEVSARAGFAQFRMPAPGKSLQDVLTGNADAVKLVRDHERRIMTTIEWEAAPQTTAEAQTPLELIGGYDVHESDLDELAPSQVGNASTANVWDGGAGWDQSRRVARVQMLRPSSAMLTPETIGDPTDWVAHYASSTWRDENVSSGTRPPWYSSREASVVWPDPINRLRVLGDPDESLIFLLMENGKPSELSVELVGPDGHSVGNAFQFREVEIPAPDPGGDNADIAPINLAEGLNVVSGKITLGERRTFTTADVRRALLALEFKDPSGLNLAELSLKVTARAGLRTAEQSFPLTATNELHPVLEELEQLLVFDFVAETDVADSSYAIYRRYTVLTQPRPALDAANLTEFMSSSDEGADPYGWKALQTLGYANVHRLFDSVTNEFVSPVRLLQRVNCVLGSILKRYAQSNARLGDPFVDIPFRPHRDRQECGFDEPVSKHSRGYALDDDDLLAFVQVAMRPTVALGWEYEVYHVKLAKPVPTGDVGTGEEGPAYRGLALRIAGAGKDFDVMRVSDRMSYVFEASRGSESTDFPLPDYNVVVPEDWAPELTFLVRTRAKRDLTSFENQLTLIKYTVEDGIMKADTLPRDYLGEVKPFSADNPVAAAIHGPANPFGKFAAKNPKEWEPVLFAEGENSTPHLAPLIKRCAILAEKFEVPPASDEDARISLVGQYLDWSQRFMEFGSAPPSAKNFPRGVGAETLENNEISAERKDLSRKGVLALVKDFKVWTLIMTPPPISFSLIAPVKQTQWQIAPDDAGMLSLSFLYKDRWAHVRRYAVRPVGRYQDLAVAVKRMTRAESEALLRPDIDTGSPEIGSGIAVSPRTERVQPPVILSSLKNSKDGTWEIVVPRHSEQSLADSNRMLFSRLGWEGTALTFFREFIMDEWVKRLDETEPVRYREIFKPVEPGDSQPPLMTDEHLADLAQRFPNLWKGADVYNIGKLPHHYKVTVAATALAGIVTSPVVAAAHNDIDYEMPDGLERDGDRALEFDVTREDGRSAVVTVTIPLLSYSDLMTDDIRDAWVDGAPSDDVAYWPDHGVIYSLHRANAEGMPKNLVLIEDASIPAVPAVKAGVKSKPYVLRARGDRFMAVAKDATDVKRLQEVGQPDLFELTVKLTHVRTKRGHPSAPEGLPMVRTALSNDDYDEGVVRDFNNRDHAYAVITQAHALRVLEPEADNVPAYIDHLKSRYPDPIEDAIVEIRRLGLPEWQVRNVLNYLRSVRARITALGPAGSFRTKDEVRAAAGIGIDVKIQWPAGLNLPGSLNVQDIIECEAMEDVEITMTMFDMPGRSDITGLPDEATDPYWQTVRDAAVRLARRMLFGDYAGFKLRGVRGVQSAMRDVDMPDWLKSQD